MKRGKYDPFGPLNTYVIAYTISYEVMYERITHYANGVTGERGLFRILDGDYYSPVDESEHFFCSDVWYRNRVGYTEDEFCIVPDVDEVIFLASL